MRRGAAAVLAVAAFAIATGTVTAATGPGATGALEGVWATSQAASAGGGSRGRTMAQFEP